jgi:hypothetical protein
MIQSTMKPIALDRFGGLETMKLQVVPVPEVGLDDERRVSCTSHRTIPTKTAVPCRTGVNFLSRGWTSSQRRRWRAPHYFHINETVGTITEYGRFRIWTLTQRKPLPLSAGAGRPPPTGLNYVVSGNEQPSAGRLLRRAVHARRWPVAILLPG